MPILKRKVIRPSDNSNILEIEDSDETTEETTQTVSVIHLPNYLICNNCGRELILREESAATIECSECGCPDFHTKARFTVKCINCDNTVDVIDKFHGYCNECKGRMWQTI